MSRGRAAFDMEWPEPMARMRRLARTAASISSRSPATVLGIARGPR
jgi:hypothetical protein